MRIQVSVSPSELRGRTRFLKALKVDTQLTPAYRDAPCAREMLLSQPMPAVTICFIMVDGVRADTLQSLRDEVRSLLQLWRGYECERNVDGFVLAFGDASDCVQFCVDLHGVGVDGSSRLRRSSSIDKELSRALSGMRIGVYTGTPTTLSPHAATGMTQATCLYLR